MIPRSPSRFLREALTHDVRTRFVGHDESSDLYSRAPARDLTGSLSRSEYLREHVGPLAQTEIERDLLLDDGGYSGPDFGGPCESRNLYSAADRRAMVEQFRGLGDDMTHARYGLGPEGSDALTGIDRFDDAEFGGEDLGGLDGGAGDEFLASGSFADHFRDFRADEGDDEPARYEVAGDADDPFSLGPQVPATAPRAAARNETGYSDAAVQLAAQEWDDSNPDPDYYGGSLLLPSTTTTLQPLPQFNGEQLPASLSAARAWGWTCALSADGSAWRCTLAGDPLGTILTFDPSGNPVYTGPTGGLGDFGEDMPDDPPLSYGEGVGIVGASAGLVGGTFWWLGAKGWWWLAALPLTYAAAGLVGVAYVLGKANRGDAAAKLWEDRVQGQMQAAALIQRKVLF